jgi:hypothetical protein
MTLSVKSGQRPRTVKVYNEVANAGLPAEFFLQPERCVLPEDGLYGVSESLTACERVSVA